MRDMHFTEAEIMDRSWALCLWDFVTLRALKGEVSMVAKEEIDKAYEVGKNLMELVKSGKLRVR